MANIIELSNLSYESRDNFQMDIAAIEQVLARETIPPNVTASSQKTCNP
jgi:hypothetical protein